jgi:hypothetical protein
MTDELDYDPLEEEEPDFARLIAEEWAGDVLDPKQDIYTEEDGLPIESERIGGS